MGAACAGARWPARHFHEMVLEVVVVEVVVVVVVVEAELRRASVSSGAAPPKPCFGGGEDVYDAVGRAFRVILHIGKFARIGVL